MELGTEEREALGDVPSALLRAAGFDAPCRDLEADLRTATRPEDVRATVRRHGRALWEQAVARARPGAEGSSDDRPLYWARLRMRAALHGGASPSLDPRTRQESVAILEAASRGREGLDFSDTPAGHRRLLVSGFDPFGFTRPSGSLRQGNPSGAAALALEGATLRHGDVVARVRSIIFPVRFADFDAGVLEQTFRRFLVGPERVDMIVTTSQGGHPVGPGSRPEGDLHAFSLERWAGRRRSSEAPDNLGVVGGSPERPTEAPGLAPGAEFLESSLPREGILEGLGRGETRSECERLEWPAGGTEPARRTDAPGPGCVAVAGSGGGFLSNEIFYRTALLRLREGSTVPVGHLHVPRIEPPAGSPESEAEHARHREEVVAGVRRILELALRHL